MPKRSTKKTDEIDWNGLFAAGSIIGNILQAADRSQLQKKLDLRTVQAQQLFHRKEGLRRQFEALKKAYDRLKNKISILEDINKQLNNELLNKNKRIQQLENHSKK